MLLSMITLAAYSYNNNSSYHDVLNTFFSGGYKDTVSYKKHNTEAFDELEKLIRHYEKNIYEVHGNIKVISSANDEPADTKEEPFQLIFDKSNYQMKYGSSETISNEKEIILVDHSDKIIFITPAINSAAGNLSNHAFFPLSALKDQIKTIRITNKGRYKSLDITMDTANKNARYEVIYDPVVYNVKTIKFSVGYPVPATAEELSGDSSGNNNIADSLILLTPDGEEFNTGHIVIHEQLMVQIHYLNEQRIDLHDFTGRKYIDKNSGKCHPTVPYIDYRIIK